MSNKSFLPMRIRIIGDHPWTGHSGTLTEVRAPAVSVLPAMGLVKLDEAAGVPYGHECFVERENIMPYREQFECSSCGYIAHLCRPVCPRCD